MKSSDDKDGSGGVPDSGAVRLRISAGPTRRGNGKYGSEFFPV